MLVASVSLIVAIDNAQLIERVGRVPVRKLERVLARVDVVLGRRTLKSIVSAEL